jgi:K+-transporting ATPase ATPase C chain
MKLVFRSTLFVVVLTVILGGVYPAAVTAVSRLFWKDRADGSFVTDGRCVVGSELIGQNFQRPEYLHPRPSAAGKDGYDATSSGGRNKGPIDAGLATSVREAIAAARADRPGDSRPVPADLATASSSGLDPHISPDAAAWQALRVARARGLTEDQVLEVIRRNTEPRTLLLLGEPRVNVLRTNLALDRAFPGR